MRRFAPWLAVTFGALLACWAGSAAQASFGLPLGLWRQPDGTVYVADGTGAIRAVR